MPRHAAMALSLFFALNLSLSAQVKDWPQWRGPQRDGIGSEKGLLDDWTKTKPRLVWNSKDGVKKSIGEGWSSVSIADGRIFTMGDHGSDCFVYALEQKTGKQLWEKKIGGTNGNGGPRCTPSVDGERLYALANTGELACLKVKSGEILWSKDYQKDFGGHWMASWLFCESPLVDGDKLVCTPGGDSAALVALNKMTGEVIWKAPIKGTGGCGYSSIMVSEGGGIRQYITFMNHGKGLVSVDAKNGNLLWNYNKVANGTANIPTVLIKGDLVFASTGYGTGAALLQLVKEGGGVKAVEKYFLPGSKFQNHHGQMILIGDHVYAGHGHNHGLPICLELMTGKIAWGPETSIGSGSAACAYADGHIYLRYEDNAVALIEATPKAYNHKGTFVVPGKNLSTGWPQPVIVDGMMYIRGRDQLMCFDVRK
jgi:outer membrane protein assembly factor BamB